MFDELKNQHQNNLPFVVFRPPNAQRTKYYLQKDDKLNTINDFTEQGFLFAPFNAFESGKIVLFPVANCEVNSIEISSKNSYLNANQIEQNSSVVTDEYLNLIDTALNEIKSGSLKKVVLSQQFSFQLKDLEPFDIFERMVNKYPTAFVYCWFHPKVGTWLGATPETLLTIDGNYLTTMSLAGTQKYNENKKVVWQKKELEEQQIVTHYILNQLKASGVQSDQITSNEVNTIRAGNLWHLQTKIDAQINTSSFSLEKLLSNLHPTPAVCGEPKLQAYQFILSNEGYDRLYYTGFLGEINIFKSLERNKRTSNIENSAYKSVSKITKLYVNLRCMQIINKQAIIYVGGGITKDSKPDNEWQELIAKLQTVKSVL
jgi:isochorismate synthase